MAKRGPKPKIGQFDQKQFLRVAHLELLRRPQPPKFDNEKGYDHIPNELRKGMSQCTICKHHFTPRPGKQANPFICGRYWCIVNYQKEYGRQN